MVHLLKKVQNFVGNVERQNATNNINTQSNNQITDLNNNVSSNDTYNSQKIKKLKKYIAKKDRI